VLASLIAVYLVHYVAGLWVTLSVLPWEVATGCVARWTDDERIDMALLSAAATESTEKLSAELWDAPSGVADG